MSYKRRKFRRKKSYSTQVCNLCYLVWLQNLLIILNYLEGQRKPAAAQRTQKTVEKVNEQQEDSDATSCNAPNPSTITMSKLLSS